MTISPMVILAEGDPGEVVNILLLVVFGVIGAISWAFQQGKAKRERDEALARRRAMQARTNEESAAKPPITGHRLERAQQAMREKLGIAEPARKTAPKARPARPAEPTPERLAPTPAQTKSPVPAAPPVTQLRSREQLRRAILYHEILAPPKALRKSDEELWNS
jgi:hypothetical protein